jgi:hypothetical protein
MKDKFLRTWFGVAMLMMATMAIVPARAAAAPQRTRGQGSATLSGVVLGPDDKPVAHASVTYQSSGGRAPHAVLTDAHGRFTVTKLRGDNYDVRASSNGTFSEWEKNVMVRPGQSQSVTLRLIYAKQMPTAKNYQHKP